ncbi:MAG: GDSL-type esterase/lipase family protein [Solirubrobacterales bacterium]
MRVSRWLVAVFAVTVALCVIPSSSSAGLGKVVAIGDSLAAGTALGPAIGSYPRCGQTSGSYPELAMSRVKYTSWTDATCNGGHSGVFNAGWCGLGGTQTGTTSCSGGDPWIPAQYNSITSDTNVVIVGSGGNEAYYGEVMSNCMGHSEDYNLDKCAQVYGSDGAGLLAKTNGSKTLMAGVLDAVHAKAPNAKVFLIGVPRIAPEDGVGCWPNPILTLNDAPVWKVWEDSLRQAMSDIVATRSSYARFVDMQTVSGTTHSMCAPSNMRWLNPWTVENITYPGLALHDTPWGADATADTLVQAFKSAGLSTDTPSAPTLIRTSPTASPTSSTSQTFSFSGTSGYTFKCRLDNAAYASCSGGTITISGVTAGAHTYSVTQTDGSGNVSPAATVTWTVDTTAPLAPTVTRVSPNTSPTNSPTQTISFVGAESGGTLECKLDSAAYASCPSSPASLSGLTTASHTYYVRQTDAAGNIGAVGSVTWTVDVTPPGAPTVTRTNPTATTTNVTTQVLTYSGAEAGGTFQCKLDSAAYSACTASPITLTGLAAGTHTYSVTQTDAVGNVGSATTMTWTVDTTAPGAPTVTRTVPTANPTNSASQTLTFAGSEAGGTFQCKLDSGSYAACGSSPVTVSGLTSGSHTYYVTQTDDAGNISAAGTAGWTVDVTPPPTPIVSGPSGTTAFSTATITYSDSESGVTFQCKLDSASYAACPASPVTLTGLSNGSHTYYVTATDATGNVSAAGTATWTVDPSGFTVSISSGPSNPSTSASATFGFAATETSGTTYECKLDSTAFAACTSTKTYSGLADGPHTFSVHATKSGQTTPDVSFSWTIDSTPPPSPTLSRTSPTASPTNSNAQTLSLSANEAGGVLTCKLDDSNWVTCPTSPITVTSLGDGSHTVSARQTDAAGNIGSVASVTWIVDTTPPAAPSITRTSPTATQTNSTSQTISYGGLEAGATTQCKIDTGAYGACQATPFTLGSLLEGSHTVQITQTDAAGNTSQPGSVTWTVDSIPPGKPTLLRTSPTADPTNSKSQQFSYSGTESGGTWQCKLDSGSYSACSASPATLTNLSDGSHTLYVTQTDSTGNVSPAATASWTVDTVAPLIPDYEFGQPAISNVNFAQIKIHPAESGGTLQCSLDSAAWTTCPAGAEVQFTLSGLSEGNHNYGMRQVDAAGNIGPGKQVAWLVDTVAPTAPTVTRTSPATSPTYDRDATISFTPPELEGTVECKLDNAAWAACPTGPVALSGLSVGAHTYSVRQTDRATNVGAVGSTSWTVELDTVAPLAPTVTRTAPTANPTSSITQTISYLGAEADGTFQCKLDIAAYAPCQSSPVTLTGMTSGTHTFYVTQTDAWGNVSPAGTVSWTVDNGAPAAPTVTRTAPTASSTQSTSQTIAYAASESGGTMQCKLDDASYAVCTSSPVTLNGLANGSHTYSVTQTDSAGNISAPGTVTWIVDTIAPAAPTVTGSAANGVTTTASSQTITFSGAEAGGTFQCKADSDAWALCSSPTTKNDFAEGSHSYSVRQIDAAGNIGAVATISWTVDPNGPDAPTVTRTSPTENPTTSSAQTITYSGEDGGVFICSLDDATYVICPVSPVTLTGLGNGAHRYSVVQVDQFSRVSEATSVSWTIGDAPAPPTLSRASSVDPTNQATQTFSYSGTGDNHLECKLDAAAWSGCPASPIDLNLGDGMHTLQVRQVRVFDPDVKGDPASVTWTVDTVAPAPPTVVRSNPVANTTTSTTQTISYAATEPGGTLECKLDEAEFGPCSGNPLVLTGLALGTHAFSVRQIDAAGNVSHYGAVTWTVEKPRTPEETPLTAKLGPIGPNKIKPSRGGAAFATGKRSGGGTFKITLSKAATISLRLDRLVDGRKTASGCKATAKSVAKSKRCTTSKAATSSYVFALPAGSSTIHVSGRSGSKALSKGSYRVRVDSRDLTAALTGKTFRIAR